MFSDPAPVVTAQQVLFSEIHESLGQPRLLQGAEGTEDAEGAEGMMGEEGAEAEEEEFTPADVEVAWMLLGSVSFVMGLLYLVNWDDDDIRRYTWKIISTTISIFLAVLLFQGFNQVLKKQIEGMSETKVAIVQILHCFAYVVAMQVTVAYISGAIFETQPVDLDKEEWVINDALRKDNGNVVDEGQVRNASAKRSVILDWYGMEVAVAKIKRELEVRNRRMKCYARLLAHMAGFAAINAGATLQQLEFFRESPVMAALPIVITQGLLLAVFGVLNIVRNQQVAAAQAAGRAGRRATMYHEEVLEAENDISSLSMSFLFVNVLRFAISGILPNEEGLEPPEAEHSLKAIITIFGIGVAFAAIACGLVLAKARQGDLKEDTLVPRLLLIGLNGTAMAFAWCMLWGTRWFCGTIAIFPTTSVIGRVIIALAVSALAGLAVFGLDTLDDAHSGSEDSRAGAKAIQTLVNALGILIGFSWEHCFDGGVAAVASQTRHHVETTKFAMGLGIAVLVTPMWRRHILTKEMALEKLKEDREDVRNRRADGKQAEYQHLEDLRNYHDSVAPGSEQNSAFPVGLCCAGGPSSRVMWRLEGCNVSGAP